MKTLLQYHVKSLKPGTPVKAILKLTSSEPLVTPFPSCQRAIDMAARMSHVLFRPAFRPGLRYVSMPPLVHLRSAVGMGYSKTRHSALIIKLLTSSTGFVSSDAGPPQDTFPPRHHRAKRKYLYPEKRGTMMQSGLQPLNN